jgi:hypothetical protein
MNIRPGALAAIAVAGAVFLGAGPAAATVSAQEYRAAKGRIEAEYRDSVSACGRLAESIRHVCREEAAGKRKVARAELEFNRTGSPADADRLVTAKADAAYALAVEKCEDRLAADQPACRRDALALQRRSFADAKAQRKSTEERRDLAEERRNAAYNLAKERCEALSGDARASCLAAARARLGGH